MHFFPNILFLDRFIEKAVSLQESLSNLSLNPVEEAANTDKILVDKVISSRNFRKFTIFEITQKDWKLVKQLQIEKIEESTFKFVFCQKKDRDFIYKNSLWSLNGSLLVLKEWPLDIPLESIYFDTTSFFIQIHGLPPLFLHEKTATKNGNQIGQLHTDSIHRWCIVGHRYLRIRVDIAVNEATPEGFF